MRFFLDENIPLYCGDILRAAYPMQHFTHIHETDLGGSDDVPLYPQVAALDMDVFVTADKKQSTRTHERAACRAAGLHWLGINHTSATGLHLIAHYGAALVQAIPFVAERAPGSGAPQRFFIKGPYRQFEQNGTQQPL